MDKHIEKAFDFAQESTKQLIALATGMIALSITFAKDFVGTVDGSARDWALLSWGTLLLSVFFGLWTLLALTGSLQPKVGAAPPSIRGSNVILPATLQIATFFLGLVLSVVFGIVATRP